MKIPVAFATNCSKAEAGMLYFTFEESYCVGLPLIVYLCALQLFIVSLCPLRVMDRLWLLFIID